jgi:hypothetical protein
MAKSKISKPKLANCKPEDVFTALKRIGGFKIVYQSAKHTKIAHEKSGKSSTIPRHNPINRHLMKDFVNDYLIRDIGLTEEEIYKYLWC